MELTEKIYKSTEMVVHKLCHKFAKSTGIEQEELFSSCWTHIAYSIRFYDPSKKTLPAFIYMSAHNEIMNMIAARKRKIYGNMKRYCMDDILADNSGDDAPNGEFLGFIESISYWDDVFLINVFSNASDDAKEMVKAIIEEDLSTYNAIKVWARNNGWPHKKFTQTLNETRRCMTCS